MYVLINVTDDGDERSVGLVGIHADISEARAQMRRECEEWLSDEPDRRPHEIGDWEAHIGGPDDLPWEQWHIMDRNFNETIYF